MKRIRVWLGLLLAAVSVLAMGSVVSANAVHSGTGGPPVAMYSNPGSETGQAHRSPVGTYNKFTHDGFATHPPFLD